LLQTVEKEVIEDGGPVRLLILSSEANAVVNPAAMVYLQQFAGEIAMRFVHNGVSEIIIATNGNLSPNNPAHLCVNIFLQLLTDSNVAVYVRPGTDALENVKEFGFPTVRQQIVIVNDYESDEINDIDAANFDSAIMGSFSPGMAILIGNFQSVRLKQQTAIANVATKSNVVFIPYGDTKTS